MGLKRKFWTAIVLGLAGLIFSLLRFNITYENTNISLHWAFIFPLLSSIAYGPKYGILSCTLGLGAFFPFLLWPENGFANLASFILYLLLCTGTGYFSELRFKNPQIWTHTLSTSFFMAILTGLFIFLSYPPLVAINPPIWNSNASGIIPVEALKAISIKESINIFALILTAKVLSKLNIIRLFLGLAKNPFSKKNECIFILSFFAGGLFWLIYISFISIFVSNTFPFILDLINSPDSIVAGLVFLLISCVSSLVFMEYIEKQSQLESELLRKNIVMNTLLDNLDYGVFMVESPSGRPIIANPKAKKLLGQGILPDANKDNLSQVYKAYKPNRIDLYPVEEMPIIKGMRGEISRIDDMIIVCPDGRETWLEVMGCPIFDYEEKVWASLVSFHDITERKVLEKKVFKEKEQFKTTLLSVGDGIVSTDSEGKVVILNPVAEELTGYKESEALGKSIEDVFKIFNELTGEKCENPVKKVLETGEIIEMLEHTLLISKDGRQIAIEDSAAPIRDENGNITGVVLVFRDFTAKKKNLEQIKYLSYHDHLTGLYNRRFFEAEMRRLDTERNLPLTIIMGDVNGLKLINDAFGHLAGDELLVKASEIIKKSFRADDIVARIGGDEVAILLPHTDEIKAQKLIERMKSELKKEKIRDVEVSVSFGFETKKSFGESLNLVLQKSEDEMYKNKLFEGPKIRKRAIDNIMDRINEKNPREKAHSERVAQICVALGKAIGMDHINLSKLKTLGLFHDIGKIAVSDNILNKSNELTDLEYKDLCKHVEIGYRILSASDEMSEIAENVLCHHERWDGEGYPRGLSGESIPLLSRICSIADAYDAMTSERSYRPAQSTEMALQEIKMNSGKQFDPKLVEVFIKNCIEESLFY